MIPFELKDKEINLPETDNHSIVLITGNSLRHKRFALRIIQEFGDLVVGWFEISQEQNNVDTPQKRDFKTILYKILKKTGFYRYYYFLKVCFYLSKKSKSINILKIISTSLRLIKKENDIKNYRKYFKEAESKIFEKEVHNLQKAINRVPLKISNPNSEKVIKKIKSLDPYFFLTLSGPLYKGSLLKNIRGVCINQHAGHSPDIKGTRTIEWALYFRKIDLISSTVHITNTGADSGPIIRRSQPCLLPSDGPGACFARVVALGTELMIEIVHEIIKNKKIVVFEQPSYIGQTFLAKDINESIIGHIYNDFKTGWFAQEKSRLRQF